MAQLLREVFIVVDLILVSMSMSSDSNLRAYSSKKFTILF